MSEADSVTVRELKRYADDLAKQTRVIAESLARDTEAWRIGLENKIAVVELKVETRLTRLEVKMNIIAFLAGTGAAAGIADMIRIYLHLI